MKQRSPLTYVSLFLLGLSLLLGLQAWQTSSGPPVTRGYSECNAFGLKYPGGLVCSCFGCRGGDQCQDVLPNCSIDLGVGSPGILEAFWVESPRLGHVSIPAYYEMPYGPSVSLPLLQTLIDLHSNFKNAVTDDKNIVLGYGATQLIRAAMFAIQCRVAGIEPNPPASELSKMASMTVFCPVPHYGVYSYYTEGSMSKLKFNTSKDQPNASCSNTIEIVTYPNNPDGARRPPQFENSWRIYDMVYYWPHFTHIDKPMNEDIMLFSASKLTGHAGNRFGWAVVKDEKVAQLMQNYIELEVDSFSADLSLKFLRILAHVDQDFFDYISSKMEDRWNKLREIVPVTNQRFRIANQQEKPHGGFFLWIQCLREEDSPCAAIFTAAGYNVMSGEVFGETNDFVRVNFAVHDQVLELFFVSLKQLANE